MLPERWHLIAAAAFGLEGIAASELKRIGLKDAKGESGGARFTGTAEDIFRANMRLRCADRVLIILKERPVYTFDELFLMTQEVPWEELLAPDAAIHISGKCVRSQLMSVRDCQAIVKKAIIERLKAKTGRRFFPETGTVYPIGISIHSDQARLTLDTSGDALNRRGYRTWNGEAPLRETLAAAMIELSPWRPGMPLHDPCCGTGTLLIEAAWRASHRAPGLTRHFACEDFAFFPEGTADRLRAEAEAEILPERIGTISGSDKDPEALKLARRHTAQAGLEGRITLTREPLETLQLSGEKGVFICNPPYGMRLGDRKSCGKLYHELGLLQKRHPGWTLCAIASDPGFERSFGRRAGRKRRLYNGRLECEFMVFEGK